MASPVTAEGGLHRLNRDSPPYPPALVRHLGDRAPAVVSGQGNLEILGGSMLALFCSVRCPGDLILKTYDLARALRDAGVTVIGGFHSPMEKECLALLLLSRFDGKQRRVTAELATIRNEFLAAIADKIFITHAGAGSRTERFCRDVLAWGKPILTLESSENANLIALGARPVRPESISEQRV